MKELEFGKIFVLKLDVIDWKWDVRRTWIKNLISQFASQQAGKIDFKLNIL